MESSSYFIKDKALFGSFPTQQSVYELEKEGVTNFIDLTFHDEKKIVPYITTQNYINFPIVDQNIPTDLQDFSRFILQSSKIIRELQIGEKVYIHCKGGHGRSGIIVACILCYIFSLSPYESLQYTTQCHNNRKNMRERWRKIGSPQTYSQKKFVYKSFHPVNMNALLKHVINEPITINIYELGENKSVHDYFALYSEKFIENPLNTIFDKFRNRKKSIIEEKPIEWLDIKDNILKFLFLEFFKNNTEVKEHFLRSFLRPIIITYIESNVFWKNNGIELSKISNILSSIRVKFLQEN